MKIRIRAAQLLALFVYPLFLIWVYQKSKGTDWGWFIREFGLKDVAIILWESLWEQLAWGWGNYHPPNIFKGI